MSDEKQAERDEQVLEAMREAEFLEQEFKKAVILLARQIPALIDEMRLLRGALNRHR